MTGTIVFLWSILGSPYFGKLPFRGDDWKAASFSSAHCADIKGVPRFRNPMPTYSGVWGYIGIMEEKMETRGIIGYTLGLDGDYRVYLLLTPVDPAFLQQAKRCAALRVCWGADSGFRRCRVWGG